MFVLLFSFLHSFIQNVIFETVIAFSCGILLKRKKTKNIYEKEKNKIISTGNTSHRIKTSVSAFIFHFSFFNVSNFCAFSFYLSSCSEIWKGGAVACVHVQVRNTRKIDSWFHFFFFFVKCEEFIIFLLFTRRMRIICLVECLFILTFLRIVTMYTNCWERSFILSFVFWFFRHTLPMNLNLSFLPNPFSFSFPFSIHSFSLFAAYIFFVCYSMCVGVSTK